VNPAIFLALASATMFIAWWVATYNRGVRVHQHIRESRSNIDVQLKRRHDLIPNLVAVCKAYAIHEREVLETVVTARNQAVTSLQNLKSGYDDENQLVHAVNQLMTVVENYPQLRADSSFLALQKELVNTEDRIAAARRFYNANCRSWNVLRESFPSSLVVKGAPAFYFEVEPLALQTPAVDV
jgi:LemA protein